MKDLLEERHRRIRSLKIQAGKARRYQELRAELRDMRTAVAVLEARDLRERLHDKSEVLESLADELAVADARCAELGIPIMMQVGHCLVYQKDFRLPSVGRPITLDRIAIDFPELTIIGIHLGYPWTEEMISVCTKHENVYMAGDAYAPKHWGQSATHYANTYGQDKFMFGTDWWVIDPERAVQEVDELDFRPASRRKIMRDNAMKVFNLPE